MEEKRLYRVVRRAIRGDEEAFNELICLRGKNILYIAISLMGDRHDGEDAAQDAVIRIRKTINGLKNPRSFDAWMYRIVYSTCMDAKSKMKRNSTYMELEGFPDLASEENLEFLPEEYVHSEDRLKVLANAVRELPDRYRLCLLLYYYENMSYEEIADVLDIKTHDVSNTLTRAKKKLRCSLNDVEQTIRGGTSLSAKSGVSFGVAMVAVFNNDANTLVPSNTVSSFLSSVLREIPKSVAASSAGHAFVLPFSSGIGQKIVSVAVVAVLGFGAVGAVVGGGLLQALNSDTRTISSTGVPQKNTEVSPADVIAPKQAMLLEAFSSTGQPKTNWEAFVSEGKFLYIGKTIDAQNQYIVYSVENPENHLYLVMIARIDDAGSTTVAYNTSQNSPTLPARAAVIRAFEEWS